MKISISTILNYLTTERKLAFKATKKNSMIDCIGVSPRYCRKSGYARQYQAHFLVQ